MQLQVELPNSERTVVRVPPTITMGKLLLHICEKRNIDPAHHKFNLPVTEESLAKKVLRDLHISSIGLLCKGVWVVGWVGMGGCVGSGCVLASGP